MGIDDGAGKGPEPRPVDRKKWDACPLWDNIGPEARKKREQARKKCKGCGQDIVGFETDGYCEDCLCPGCGNVIEDEEQRAMGMCEECEYEETEE